MDASLICSQEPLEEETPLSLNIIGSIISLPLYLATEQLSTIVSPSPYMDTVCKKRLLHELQLTAIFNSVVSGSSSKGTASAQAARLAE